MNNLMKKYLTIFSTIAITSTSASAVVSCTNNDTEDIYRPAPIMPIAKTGFENVNIEVIDMEKINYTNELLTEINQQLELAGYDLNNIDYQVYKNESQISIKDDLYRNGNYQFIITNKNNENDSITASISITNSLHLMDNFKITSIGSIYDQRPKSIMMALMFYNLDMVNELTNVAVQLTNSSNYQYTNTGATLSINNEVPTSRPTQFYGQLELKYNVVPFDKDSVNTEWPVTIAQMVKLAVNKDTLVTNFGRVNGKDPYTILMLFIMENLANPMYWGLFINDLDLDNFTAQLIDEQTSTYEMKFYSKSYNDQELPENPDDQNGEYDKFAHYLNDEQGIILTFRYFE
ncbi:lipoprotein [Spiroplasma culicicola]|uniref:Lipoprotein n=1 Tax=Spiroplasma culicicola AES-1 TaxID=1276246 RepID=W6A5T5_9MOLU|nr:lipoprotein [Spiroplasma culicicola]AHI52498.1 hypothetical protein SCULI_v1c01570 [Spiroplasma culicicola AES-1]